MSFEFPCKVFIDVRPMFAQECVRLVSRFCKDQQQLDEWIKELKEDEYVIDEFWTEEQITQPYNK